MTACLQDKHPASFEESLTVGEMIALPLTLGFFCQRKEAPLQQVFVMRAYREQVQAIDHR
jgi:hypothetical protein